MKAKSYTSIFYTSLFLGIFVWTISIALVPASPLTPPLKETLLFFALSYLAVILGYHFAPKSHFRSGTIAPSINSIRIVTHIVLCAFLIRFIDLFYYRGMSIFNTVFQNRALVQTPLYFYEIPFKLASILKACYFVPLILVLTAKKSISIRTSFLSKLTFALPLIEALLLGSRKTIFEMAILLFIILVIYSKASLKKWIIICVSVACASLSFTTYILKQRVTIEYASERGRNELMTSRYNDLLPLNESFKNHLINETKNDFEFNLKLIVAHYGQYINHGLFELDNIFKSKNSFDYALGRHTFSQLMKPLSLDANANPRRYTYVTFFGALFLDFGWWSLVFFIIFGGYQKRVFTGGDKNLLDRAILPYIVMINISIPVMCAIRGSGLYPFLGTFFLYFVVKLIYQTD
ncbi:MAG: hypothetical protein ACPGC2_00395 [Flavobacteriaceae bacterium]